MSITVEIEKMIEEKILLIITSELTGQVTKDENEILKDWLDESKLNLSLYHSYKEAFINGKYDLKVKGNIEVYNKLTERLGFNDKKITSLNDGNLNTQRRNSLYSSIRRIAATILILITTAIVVYQTKELWVPTQNINNSNGLIVKSNPRGVKTLITLPDGSKVKLNSESYIEYYSDFEKSRKVKLIGEAFFDVVRDTLNSFYVIVGDLNVKVLGTSFNVEAFPFEDKIKVALVSGKVMIEKQEGLDANTLGQLDPAEMFIYDHQTSDYNKTTFDYNESISWKDGKLIFKEAKINEVVKKLERWYGVEIIVNDWTDIVGGFNGIYTNAPLEVVLEGMGFTSDFNFKIKGKKVFIN